MHISISKFAQAFEGRSTTSGLPRSFLGLPVDRTPDSFGNTLFTAPEPFSSLGTSFLPPWSLVRPRPGALSDLARSDCCSLDQSFRGMACYVVQAIDCAWAWHIILLDMLSFPSRSASPTCQRPRWVSLPEQVQSWEDKPQDKIQWQNTWQTTWLTAPLQGHYMIWSTILCAWICTGPR